MSTTAPIVKAALATLLAGLDAQVIYGPRTAVSVTKANILTIGRVRGTTEFTNMGMTTSEERYTVALEAMSSVPGSEQRRADEAALATYAAARALVDGHHFGDTISANCTGEFELDEEAAETGRHAIVRFAVEVYATT